MPKFFTLTEANEALKMIRPLIEEALVIRGEVLARQPEIWDVMQKSAGNGGSPALSRLVQSFDRFDAIIHQIQDSGVLIKDINIGLLDFPAAREGREVYLCWKHGEGDIAYWHEIEEGYAGRQPITNF